METNTIKKPIRLFTETMVRMYRRGYFAKELHANQMTNGTMTRISVECLHYKSTDPFVQCSPMLFDGISGIKPMLLIGRIMSELKMNNPLWKCLRPRTSQTRAATDELVKKEILIAIKGTDYFLVSPEKIWRGNQLVVCTSFLKWMDGKNLASINDSDIKDLPAVNKYPVVGIFDEWDNPKVKKGRPSRTNDDQPPKA